VKGGLARFGRAPAGRFAAWAIAPWALLLVAALALVQYLQHGDRLYVAAALLVIAVSAGCILRQPWARNAMRVVAVLLALWALLTGALMLQHWGDFARAREHALTQPLAELTLWMIARAQRVWQVSLTLKAAAIPLLLWLAWLLGRPAVREEFGTRRARL
jgi:hypothetical protein